MRSKDVYINYLIQSKANPMDAMLSHASPACIPLLGAIAVADFQGQPLTISQIMAMTHWQVQARFTGVWNRYAKKD